MMEPIQVGPTCEDTLFQCFVIASQHPLGPLLRRHILDGRQPGIATTGRMRRDRHSIPERSHRLCRFQRLSIRDAIVEHKSHCGGMAIRTDRIQILVFQNHRIFPEQPHAGSSHIPRPSGTGCNVSKGFKPKQTSWMASPVVSVMNVT